MGTSHGTTGLVVGYGLAVIGFVAGLLAAHAPRGRWLLAPLLGASFGALVYLCFADLLPESYRLSGRSSIAVVVTIAAGIVALATGWL